MNIKNFWFVCVALAMGAVIGCSDSDSNLFNEVADAEASAITALCECFAAAGYATAAECEADIGESYTEEEAECLEGVFDENEAALTASSDCRIEALEEAEDCLEAVVACDPDSVEACFEAAGTATDLCADPPAAVGEAIDACTPNLYDVARAVEVEAVANLCTCFSGLGYASVGECTDDFLDAPSPAEISCLQDAYDEYRSDVRPHTDCRLALLADADACVDAVAGCDSIALDACVAAAEAAGDLCPDPSMDAQDEIDSCDMPAP